MYSVQLDRGDFSVLACSGSLRDDERCRGDVVVVFFAERVGQRGDNHAGCGRGRDGDSGCGRVLEMDVVSRLESHAGGGVDAGVGRIGEVDLRDFLCLVAGDLDHIPASGGCQPLGTLRSRNFQLRRDGQ